MSKLYDRTGDKYDYRSNNPYTKHLRKKEVELIKRFAKGKVLDIGCGTGYHLNFVKGVGIDSSQKMIDLANKNGFNVRMSRAEKIPFAKDSFDTVMSMYGVLNFTDYKKAIREVKKVLKKDGIVIISVDSVYDKNYTMGEKRKLKIDKYTQTKKFNIEGVKTVLHLFTKDEVLELFKGFELLHFDSVFRNINPIWGRFKINETEKKKLKEDYRYPKEYGCFYLFVFRKKI